MCPRLHLPGHVVAAGYPVRRSLAIDGGDSRSIDVSKLVSRYGGQCLPLLGSRLCRISNAAVLWCRCPCAVYGTDETGSVSAGRGVLIVTRGFQLWRNHARVSSPRFSLSLPHAPLFSMYSFRYFAPTTRIRCSCSAVVGWCTTRVGRWSKVE